MPGQLPVQIPDQLEAHGVILERLRADHAPGLLAAAGTPETFRWFTTPPTPWDEDGFGAYIARLAENPTIAPFAVRLRASGELVGSTTYCDIRPAHRGLEIGWTWYAPAHRGTMLNPACKRLLLGHAFDRGVFDGEPAIRVQLKTDARNERSRAAILKLGAFFEGTVRAHLIMPNGDYRSSALYSITTKEWPMVRDRLDERLAT